MNLAIPLGVGSDAYEGSHIGPCVCKADELSKYHMSTLFCERGAPRFRRNESLFIV